MAASTHDSQFDLFGDLDAAPAAASGNEGLTERPGAASAAAGSIAGSGTGSTTGNVTDTAAPKRARRARAVLAAPPSPDVLACAQALPPQVRLGTSSWSFPGWEGIVYGEAYSDSKLARDGLAAYGAHPLLRTVSIDRSFYAPLSVADYLRYAQQVPEGFRFVVKAPASVTDATLRAERGEPIADNPCFLDARLAASEFVTPCLDGLGAKAGSLVFQFPPLPERILADPLAFVERLAAFSTRCRRWRHCRRATRRTRTALGGHATQSKFETPAC